MHICTAAHTDCDGRGDPVAADGDGAEDGVGIFHDHGAANTTGDEAVGDAAFHREAGKTGLCETGSEREDEVRGVAGGAADVAADLHDAGAFADAEQ